MLAWVGTTTMGTGPYPTRRPFLAAHDIAWMPRVIEEGNSSANAMGRSENGKEVTG